MELSLIAITAAGLLVFSLISGRLEGTIITPPLVFIAFGFLLGGRKFAVLTTEGVGHAAIHTIAEFTLILVLFTDAARINLSRLRKDHNLLKIMGH